MQRSPLELADLKAKFCKRSFSAKCLVVLFDFKVSRNPTPNNALGVSEMALGVLGMGGWA